MTSSFGLPRLLKGAIIDVGPFNPVPAIVVFQCNADTMTRQLEQRAAKGAARFASMRLMKRF